MHRLHLKHVEHLKKLDELVAQNLWIVVLVGFHHLVQICEEYANNDVLQRRDYTQMHLDYKVYLG